MLEIFTLISNNEFTILNYNSFSDNIASSKMIYLNSSNVLTI